MLAKLANPVILFILLCLLGAVGYLSQNNGQAPSSLNALCLSIAVTAFLVNFALCIARLMRRGKLFSPCLWSILFFSMGLVLWSSQFIGKNELTRSSADFVLAEEWEGRPGGELLTAVVHGKHKDLEALISAPDFTPQAEEAQAALVLAAEFKRAKALKTLLAAGAPPNERWKGESPLSMAALVRWYEGMRLLIAAGADVDSPDEHGNTPLMQVTISPDARAIKILREAGANPQRCNENGDDALSMAPNDTILQLLEKN